jgi:hypothetical protein
VELKDIAIHEIDTADNIADIFTKALPRDRHQLLTAGLHLHPLPAYLTRAAGHSPGGSVGGATGEATANKTSPGGDNGHVGAPESP